MAIKVILASNSTTGVVANSTNNPDAVTGELFINTADGIAWVKHSNGSFVRIIGPPGPPGPPSSPPVGGGGP
jgi:hypothetical protein